MIPRLASPLLPLPGGLFEALLEAGFQGDLEDGAAGRMVMATDNSVYQIAPKAVIFPKDGDDLALLMRVMARPEHRHHKLAARGGGTGTNGQSLTDGIVVDLSRHMTRILSIDPVTRRARVEAGVVKDQLNRALRPHGLFFAPELSTSNRATIGGMVATDASGQGSCLYGKTSAHVRGLRLVLEDGSDHWSAPGVAPAGRLAEVTARLQTLARDHEALIGATYPKLNRFLTGYDLAHLHDAEGRFDLNSVICGAEGTLALVAEVEVSLTPIPAHSALITVQYADFDTALRDARLVTGLRVASVETVDEKVLGLAKGDLGWAGIAAHFPPAPGALGVNLIEVLGETPETLEEGIARVQAAFAADEVTRTVALVHDKPAIAAIWAMRKKAVGLLGAMPGPLRPLPFVEDTAVPPEALADYIRDFRALLDAEGLEYGMFGHVDAGVLHVRPALDLTDPDLRPKLRRITDAVVALTQAYGGVLWGEHGKGLRSDYAPEVFGPLYPVLQEVKAAFDPENRLNPGKVATPPGARLTALDAPPMRGDFDRGLSGFPEALACNGNGACFDFDMGSAMCPSYKATRDRRHSPKGRAALVREWLRLAGPLTGGAGFWRRAWNTLNPANRGDFSHEVAEAMAGCLSCKACAGQCPVKVDVPAFRARFLQHYHRRYLRPLRARLMAEVETLLPLIPRPLWNLATQSPLPRALGLTALPRKARPHRETGVPTLIFVVDPFTAHFDPAVVEAACRVARALGEVPGIVTPRHGKALQVQGLLDRFAKVARATHAELSRLGLPLVGLDPAMTLIFRDDYAKLGLALPVQLPQEWLAGRTARLPALSLPKDLTLMLHCTERATQAQAGTDWTKVFAALGHPVQIPPAGCCGMAGSFGHETRNRAVSETLHAAWAPRLTGSAMATGQSCRAQSAHLSGRRPPHPLEVIAAALPRNER